MKKIFFCLIFLIQFSSFSQENITISGQIIDAKTKEAIPFANIFIEGTTIGTQSDEKGTYSLSRIPKGKFQFVASSIGYLPYSQIFSNVNSSIKKDIYLQEDVKYLSEVKVTAKHDKAWERNLHLFEKEFLGNDFNKKLVTIQNPEVIDFKVENGVFIATANQPIVIENKYLGYKYTYILQNFENTYERLAYKGMGRFEILETTDKTQIKKFENHRETAFKGSLKHFLKSIIQGNLLENGYNGSYVGNPSDDFRKVQNIKINRYEMDYVSQIQYPFIAKNSIYPTEVENQYLLILDCPLQLYYSGKNETERSYLSQLGNIIVTADGDLIDPYSIQIFGSMASQRIAKTLPFDYALTQDDDKTIIVAEPEPKPNILSSLPFCLKESIKYSREKVDIDGIEPYYLAGETIDIEANVKDLSTQTSSQISQSLYVDLIDLAQGKLLKHYNLFLENGMANFKIPINRTLTTGKYQIRAYTNWMRNYSENLFFTKNFDVFSEKYKQELKSQPEPIFDSLSISIESRKLVDKLRTKVLVNTFNNFGNKLPYKFNLFSTPNELLIEGETDSTGSIIFELVPHLGRNYHIKAGNKTLSLPDVQATGTIITVNNLAPDFIKIYLQQNAIEASFDTLTLALIQEGAVKYWKSFLNNSSQALLQIPKADLNGTFQLFLLDKFGNTLAERGVNINSELPFLNQVINDAKAIGSPNSNFLAVNKVLPFFEEKGIYISGHISKINGKPNKKPVSVSLMVSSLPSDSIKIARQSYHTQTFDSFIFEDLPIFGKKQLIFYAPDNEVTLDSAENIPAIMPKKIPVNWEILKNKSQKANLEKKENALIEQLNAANPSDKTLDEIKIKAKKTQIYAVEGIEPALVLPSKMIENHNSMKNLLLPIIMARKNRFDKIEVYLDNQRISNEDQIEIDNFISPAQVESISIFEIMIPTDYAWDNPGCVIVINSKKGAGNIDVNTKLITIKGFDN
jgi:CarboxypepD_reg-like domain